MASKQQMRAVFLGGPGAGKGTQAKRIAAERGVAHLSTGDMLRQQVAERTDLGRKAKEFMDAGKLVPDDLIVAMVAERIARPDAAAGWILDGFPRTLAQAQALDRLPGPGVAHAVFFDVPDAVLLRRLAGRRTCGKCGAIWHVETKPTKKEGICDSCGGPLQQRADDQPAAIQKRLQEFHTVTADPLRGHYEASGKLRIVAADRAPDAVHAEVERLLA